MKKKVLFIENDDAIRHIVALILEEQGFNTMSIPEPEDLKVIISFAPDVILLDEYINSRPGHRLCLKIKQIEALKHLPVIILSTSNHIELIAQECQANDYIMKPFDVEDLVNKVVGIVNRQHIPVA